MTTIFYQGKHYECREGETILDVMLRHGVDFPFSCRNGVCHVCLHRAERGRPPADSQRGLSDEQRAQGQFMPCLCRPTEDMHIEPLSRSPKVSASRVESSEIAPDPQMWAALGEGELLGRILDDFYTRVYDDARLAPFFHGVTRQRAIEKQFLFLRQLFTGEKVYFGDRPRNAHHWMVISDELFDYREMLMLECLRRHGLAEHLVQRWLEIEERFRADIVKDVPRKRKMGDVELPVDGYGEAVMEVGSLCDSCGDEIPAGLSVRYHLRLGHIYCPQCSQARA